MVLGIACWVLSALFVTAASYLLQRELRTTRPALNAVVFVFLAILTTTAISLILGLAGQLRPLPMGLVGLFGMALLAVISSTRRMLAELPFELRAFQTLLSNWWRELPAWIRWVAAVFGVVSAARFVFLILTLPPFVWDSLTYHLPNVAYWTQTGRIATFDSPVPRIFNPANYEVFAAWFTVFLHHDVVVEAAGIPAYVVACLSVYSLGRSLGLAPRASLLAALGYASTPALLLATTGTKNDPFIAAYFLMGLAIVAELSSREDLGPSRAASGSLVVLLASLLLGFGTKTYMAILAPGILLVGLAGPARNQNLRTWAGILGRFLRDLVRGDRGFRLASWTVLTAALFLASYWYVRNWVVTGNPFHPYGVVVGNETIQQGIDVTFELSSRTFRQNLESFWFRFGDKQGRIVPDLSETTGWGWFAYGLGLPALLWGSLRPRRSMVVASAGFVLSSIALLSVNRFDPWSMRFFTWMPALLCMLVGDMVQGLPAWPRVPTIGIRTLAILCIGLNLAMTLNYNRIPLDEILDMLKTPIWDRQAASLRVIVPEEYGNALAYVPREDLLGYNVGSNGFIYPLFRADFSQSIVYVPFDSDASCEGVAKTMESHGTRWLFVAPEHTDDLKIALLRKCSDSGTRIRERARGVYVIPED